MKKVTLKALVALAAVAAWGSASAVPMYLNQIGLRAGSGTRYLQITDGSDIGGTASTATWDWTGGVLTMTSGTLYAAQRIGSAPAGSLIVRDIATDLVIDTNAGTTTASSYFCVDGDFNDTIADNCANTSNGTNTIDESTVAFNVGGMADCEVRTIGGDDAAGTAAPPGFRGLRDHFSDDPVVDCGSNEGRGALDMIYVIENTGTTLILAGWNSLKNPNIAPGTCINPGSVPGETGCGRLHWMVFSSTVPVPAAVWLFGSALGVLGWVRRRAKA
jgi:hypothetical protein